MGGLLFAFPNLGPWASDPKSKKIGGLVQFWETPFGPLVVTCPFLQFWTPEHKRYTWNTLTPTDTQPIARKPTSLGAKLK